MNTTAIVQAVNELYSTTEITYLERIQGGMSNENHLVRVDGIKMLYRIPGDKEGYFVSYADEVINTELRKIFQYIPNVYVINESGEKLSEYIEGETLSKTDDLVFIGKVLKDFHQNAEKAQGDYNPFDRLQKFEKLAEHAFQGNSSYMLLREYLWSKKTYLESISKVHCHNDFQFNNIIKTEDERIFIIDWEFAGNNDPMYDIGCVYMAAGFESAMEVYAGYTDTPHEEEIERIQDWTIFQYIQWANVASYKSRQKKYDHFGYDFQELADFFVEQAMKIYQKSQGVEE